MPQNQISPDAVQCINDFNSLLQFCGTKLGWGIDPDYEFDELTFDWRQDELNLSEDAAGRLRGGVVRQLREFAPGQPWGVFFVEFATEKVYRASLRQILRALIPRQRARPDQPVWQHENLLFICATRDYQEFTFAHFRGAQAARSVLTTFGWRQGDTHLRTLCEHNLPALTLPRDTTDANGWLEAWRQAFDIEKVTGKFFDEYSQVFTRVEAQVRRGIPAAEQARLYTQRLFNRLMFIYFIQKKGWLSFQGDKNYLRAMYDEAMRRGENFKRERLYWLFFWGMSNVGEAREAHAAEVLRERRGDVPFLNGGLFDMEDEWDGNRDAVPLDNDDFAAILALFERYNFTVEESTPLDVQVAVDPEMLGKVFEELVTGRHESGSYYTPRPIVSFMCREALKHYLKNVEQAASLFPDNAAKNVEQAASLFPDRLAACRTPDVEQAASLFPDRLAACRTDAIARFVDEGDAGELNDPESVLAALQTVKVCDPACGSGAYLLGMLQELMRLRATLFQSRRLDAASLYERKRSIIENNLYGVDKDPFAVQIACLRLWLSLAIEADEPQPLPNLDFKIGCGDSLLAPAPSESEKQMTFGRGALVAEYRRAKGDYVRCNNHEQKARLRERIAELRTEIALALHHQTPRAGDSQIKSKQARLTVLEQNLASARNPTIAAQLNKEADKIRRTLHEWQQAAARPDESIFDWAVEFAEVFMPETQETSLLDEPPLLFEDSRPQATLTEQAPQAQTGGFDIVLANPPYVQQEDIDKSAKPRLLRLYAEAMAGKSDLYVAFYARALELLKPGGVHVFVCSNSWLDVGYGSKLQTYLLKKAHVAAIYDSAIERQFSTAKINTIISFLQKQSPQDTDETKFVSLRAPFTEAIADDSKCRTVTKTRAELLASGANEKGQYEGDKWGGKFLRAPDIYFAILKKGGDKFIRLGYLAPVRRGITTGANDFFYLNDDDQLRWQIEPEFLKPAIKSPRECHSIVIKDGETKLRLFTCHRDKIELVGTKALSYIEYGESDEFWVDEKTAKPNPPYSRPSCRTRRLWYDLGNRRGARVNVNYLFDKVIRFYIKDEGFIVSDNFQEIHAEEEISWQLAVSANSTIFQLFANVAGRANFGDGLMKLQTYEVAAMSLFNPYLLNPIVCREALTNGKKFDLVSQDRRVLDAIIFDALGLTAGEREGVYEAVVDLVAKRLQKAGTISR